MALRFAVAALAAASTTVSQFVPPPQNFTTKTGYAGVQVRYKQVPPGICELNPHVKSYSGYFDVGKDQHLFFWFFEARNVSPTKEAPLSVWINGGPGSSSMIGLFQELGPCYIDENLQPYDNPYSWSTVSNMLFIDQPVDTGLSYSKTVPGYLDQGGNVNVLPGNHCPANQTGNCGTFTSPDTSLTANSTDAAAPNFWKAIQGFMGAFPQYSRNGFHFTTESYGGHYGPVFNEYIEKQNANLPKGAKEVHLESVAIGNGWYEPNLQYQAYYNYTVFPGNTYDYSPYNKTVQDQIYKDLYGPGGCVDRTKECQRTGNNTICSDNDAWCAEHIEEPLDILVNRDEYDIRELQPDPFPYNFFIEYLNLPKVQQAVGAFTNFTESNSAVGNAFASTGDDDREEGTVEAVRSLLKQGVYVFQYNGDADYNCNWLGNQAVVELLDPPGYQAAGFANISTYDGEVHGVVRQAGNFAFARIYYSGHEVPFYQPLVSLQFFNRTIHLLDVETGTVKVAGNGSTKGYLTKGPKQSLFREGNATIQYEVLPANATYNLTTHAPNPY